MIISLDSVAGRCRAQGVPCIVEDTGGGIVTLFAGTAEKVDVQGALRYPLAMGPGYYAAGHVASVDTGELWLGPDADSGDEKDDVPFQPTEDGIVAAIVTHMRSEHPDRCSRLDVDAEILITEGGPLGPTPAYVDMVDRNGQPVRASAQHDGGIRFNAADLKRCGWILP
jgi:hypothetical protein